MKAQTINYTPIKQELISIPKAAYKEEICDFIMDGFHIYAVDMVGHPGKSAETSLPAKGYDISLTEDEMKMIVDFLIDE